MRRHELTDDERAIIPLFFRTGSAGARVDVSLPFPCVVGPNSLVVGE